MSPTSTGRACNARAAVRLYTQLRQTHPALYLPAIEAAGTYRNGWTFRAVHPLTTGDDRLRVGFLLPDAQEFLRGLIIDVETDYQRRGYATITRPTTRRDLRPNQHSG